MQAREPVTKLRNMKSSPRKRKFQHVFLKFSPLDNIFMHFLEKTVCESAPPGIFERRQFPTQFVATDSFSRQSNDSVAKKKPIWKWSSLRYPWGRALAHRLFKKNMLFSSSSVFAGSNLNHVARKKKEGENKRRRRFGRCKRSMHSSRSRSNGGTT